MKGALLLSLLLLPAAAGQVFVYDDPAGDQAPFSEALDYTRVAFFEEEFQVTFSAKTDEPRGFQMDTEGSEHYTIRCFFGGNGLTYTGDSCHWSREGRQTFHPAPMYWNGTTLHVQNAPPITIQVDAVRLLSNGATRGLGVGVGLNLGHPPADSETVPADFQWNGTSNVEVAPVAPLDPKETPENKETPAPFLAPLLAPLALILRRP